MKKNNKRNTIPVGILKIKTILSVLFLTVLGGMNVRAQVTVRELSTPVNTYTNVRDALAGIRDYSFLLSDGNGTVHIDITGNVTEPVKYNYPDLTFEFPAKVKKVVISSTNSVKPTVTMNADAPYAIYVLHFQNKDGAIEVSNLRFSGKDFSWIASTSSTELDATSTSYYHDCVFEKGVDVGGYLDSEYGRHSSTTGASLQSDIYLFENNLFEKSDNYMFVSNPGSAYKPNARFIFRNNESHCYRGVSVFSKTAAQSPMPGHGNRVSVVLENNTFYHLSDSFNNDSPDVTLCQVTGMLNGDYTITGNIILGHFTHLGAGVSQNQKVCSVLLQHGDHNYLGIVDGSSLTIKNNVIQCDVYEITATAGTGTEYETESIKQLILEHKYYNIMGDTTQHGYYTAEIGDTKLIHMYPSEGEEHDDDDACHVCMACGQMVVRAEIADNGGSFQYVGGDGLMHDVNDAITTIPYNLNPDRIATGADLKNLIDRNLIRDGFCLDTGKSQEFVFTPIKPGTFNTLTLYGRSTPVDVTSQATTTDGGKTYKYKFTNDFTQKNPYTECPVLIAKLNIGSISVTCTGLENDESALFDVKDAGGKILYVINLTSTNPTKIIKYVLPGSYTVAPYNTSSKNWQWAYTMTPSAAQTKSVVIGETTSYPFTAEKGDTPLHDEAIKNNAIINAREGVTVNEWETEKRKIQF